MEGLQQEGDGQAPARRVVQFELPTDGTGEPFRDRQAETDACLRGAITEPLERFEHAGPVLLGDAGALVDHTQVHLVPRAADGRRFDAYRNSVGLNGQRIRHDVGERTLQQRTVELHQRQRLGDVDGHPGRVDPEIRQRGRHDLFERRRATQDRQRPGLETSHVQQVPHHSIQPVDLVVDRAQELLGVLRIEVHIRRQQARHRGLDARQRGPQIVRDGLEDAGPQRVGLGHRCRGRRLLLQFTSIQADRQLVEERIDHLRITIHGEPSSDHRNGPLIATEYP